MAEHTIYLAGGCFWGAQKYIGKIAGVIKTTVGYANGGSENPTYEDVCASSGHAETVKTVFDDEKLPLESLLKVFYRAIDPTSVNKQGGDCGVQYRTGVYYTDESDREIIEKSLLELSKQYDEKIAVECKKLDNFYEAEEYHQNYLEKNPDGYCHLSDGDFVCAAEFTPPMAVIDGIKNAYNLRDLGGYACKKDGKRAYTANGVFLRCDSTSRLTEEECEALRESGLTTVIDLRSEYEIKAAPTLFENFEGIEYINISMLDNVNSAMSIEEMPDNLGDMYCAALKGSSEQIARLMTILADCEGTALFNCTAGKDRTGVTAMMLLDLAGVSYEDIIDDYVKTEERIRPIIEVQIAQLKSASIKAPEHLLHAEKENAEKFMDFLYREYGGAREYLKAQSVSDEKIDKLLRKFVK